MSGRDTPWSRRRVMRGIAGLGLAAAWPLAAGCGRSSQQKQPAAVRRVGWLADGSAESNAPLIAEFGQRLAALGWVEGKNIAFEFRFSDNDPRRNDANAAELLGVGVDVIVTTGPSATLAARRATTTIPIVMMGSWSDPDRIGLVPSLSRPGGNITGVAGPPLELYVGKQLELLKEAVPAVGRVGILWDTNFLGPFQAAGAVLPAGEGRRTVAILVRSIAEAGQDLGIEVEPMEVRDARGLEDVFAAGRAGGVDGVVVPPSGMLLDNALRILELTARHRVPLASFYRQYQDGALLIYTVELGRAWRAATSYVDRILRGARPADMPIERPDTYDLIINLKVAGALGLTIPPALLARATEVIQ
jgi:putative ABC transport system substrate-binding protein